MYITFSKLGFQGRLGNQLFQIAATVSSALDNNLNYFFYNFYANDYLLNPLKIGGLESTHYFNEDAFTYTKIDLSKSLIKQESLTKVYDLSGYFQSEKYFKHNSDYIKQLFLPSNKVRSYLSNKYDFTLNNFNHCSIHVRRGDYVYNNFYHELTLDYYKNAINEMKRDKDVNYFLIFSDDIEWCKNNFIGNEFVFIEGNFDFEDLILMSMCNHNIIANSSFSWWGSYLNENKNKKVVFPDKWFGSIANLDSKDIYL